LNSHRIGTFLRSVTTIPCWENYFTSWGRFALNNMLFWRPHLYHYISISGRSTLPWTSFHISSGRVYRRFLRDKLSLNQFSNDEFSYDEFSLGEYSEHHWRRRTPSKIVRRRHWPTSGGAPPTRKLPNAVADHWVIGVKVYQAAKWVQQLVHDSGTDVNAGVVCVSVILDNAATMMWRKKDTSVAYTQQNGNISLRVCTTSSGLLGLGCLHFVLHTFHRLRRCGSIVQRVLCTNQQRNTSKLSGTWYETLLSHT
jgi:hypothetical protein